MWKNRFQTFQMFKLFNNMTINHNVNNVRQLSLRENAQMNTTFPIVPSWKRFDDCPFVKTQKLLRPQFPVIACVQIQNLPVSNWLTMISRGFVHALWGQNFALDVFPPFARRANCELFIYRSVGHCRLLQESQLHWYPWQDLGPHYYLYYF